MIKMLIVVVVCYTICWLPFNVYWVSMLERDRKCTFSFFFFIRPRPSSSENGVHYNINWIYVVRKSGSTAKIELMKAKEKKRRKRRHFPSSLFLPAINHFHSFRFWASSSRRSCRSRRSPTCLPWSTCWPSRTRASTRSSTVGWTAAFDTDSWTSWVSNHAKSVV